MDIGKSFSYVFEDKKWIEKVLIGGLVSLIPFLGTFLIDGYVVELVRNVRRHDPTPLPEWDNWGEKLTEGLKLFVILFIWSLPLIFLGILSFFPLAMSGDSDSSGILGVFGLCISCFLFFYTIIYFLVMPAIVIRYAETGDIASGFQIGEIFDFTKSHLGEIIIYVIVLWLAGFVAGLVGILLCGIGLIFTMFWATLVSGHLLAQIGLKPAPATPAGPTPIADPEPTAELPEPFESLPPKDED